MRLLVYISLIIPLVRSDTCDCDQINLNIEELLRSVSDLKKANDDLTMRLDILESNLRKTDTKLDDQIQNSTEKNSAQDHEILLTQSNLNQTTHELDAFSNQTSKSIGLLTDEIHQAEKKMPVGTILPLWKLPTDWTQNWISCDGQRINQGPFLNQLAPDLNKNRRFLRGGTSSEAGSYQEADTNMSQLGGTYLDRFFVEGAHDDGIGCGEGSVVRQTDEDGFRHDHDNYECKVTRKVQFSGTGRDHETRPKNMGVLFYIKINQ